MSTSSSTCRASLFLTDPCLLAVVVSSDHLAAAAKPPSPPQISSTPAAGCSSMAPQTWNPDHDDPPPSACRRLLPLSTAVIKVRGVAAAPALYGLPIIITRDSLNALHSHVLEVAIGTDIIERVSSEHAATAEGSACSAVAAPSPTSRSASRASSPGHRAAATHTPGGLANGERQVVFGNFVGQLIIVGPAVLMGEEDLTTFVDVAAGMRSRQVTEACVEGGPLAVGAHRRWRRRRGPGGGMRRGGAAGEERGRRR